MLRGSLFNLEYPKNKYELILVNDKSIDKTLSIANKYQKKFNKLGINYKVINLHKNQGRINARIKGVSKAAYKRVMLVDVQMRIESDALKKISNYNNRFHLITNLTMDKYKNIDSTILYLLRNRYYSPYWGKEFSTINITQENFEKISKGTGGFVTNKNTFLRVSGLLEGKKIENEDTKLFNLYLKQGEQLKRVSDVKAEYVNRSGLRSIKHLFGRGPRFVDYYFKNNSSFKLIYILSLVLIIITLCFSLIFPTLILYILLSILIINFLLSTYLSENIRDMVSVFVYLPVISITFYMGITYGVYLHIIGQG